VNAWTTILVSIGSALLGGGALAVFINAVAGKRPRRAEVTERLSESTLKWVEQFQEETAAARREATDARREVAEMRRELAALRDDAEKLGRELRSIRSLILSPAATLEHLRAAVAGPGGAANGR
jgi:transposase-like protein